MNQHVALLSDSSRVEQALLGACLMNTQAFDLASDFCTDKDFFEQAHAAIWKAMGERRKLGLAIDLKLVQSALGQMSLTDLGGMSLGQYVARLAAEATSIVNAADYARSVRDAADLRRIDDVGQEISAALATGIAADPGELASATVEMLDRIVQSRSRSKTPRVAVGQAASSVIEDMRAASTRKGLLGVTTGVADLDRLLNGLQPTRFYVVAGRPGMGKTALACAMAMAAVRAGNGVGCISLEMAADELTERFMTDEAERGGTFVPYTDIKSGELGDHQIAALESAADYFQELPLLIEQEPGINVSQVRVRARQMAMSCERRGFAMRVLFIDHIGLIAGSGSYRGNKYAEMTEISNSLKALAKELGIAVVGLCQLSRQVETRDDKRPQLSDLRDTGAIEQDADVVIFPYREAYYLQKKAKPSQADSDRAVEVEHVLDIHVAKHRGGAEGHITAYCNMPVNAIRGRARI